MSITKQAQRLLPGDVIKHPNGSRATISSVSKGDDLIEIDFTKDNLCHADPTENVEVLAVMLPEAFIEEIDEGVKPIIAFDAIPDDAWGYAPEPGRKSARVKINAHGPREAFMRVISIERRFSEAFPWFEFGPLVARSVEPMGDDVWMCEVERW